MSSIKYWIHAFRLHTLPLAFSAGITGSAIAYSSGFFSWEVFGLTLLTTLFLQILSNLANDYGDAQKGVDSDERIGPQRVTQSGLISRRSMFQMILRFSVFSLLSGLALLHYAFQEKNTVLLFIFLLLGLLAIFAAIKYTIGRRPYGYTGLGDLMVFLFFGLLGVFGSYFLHAQQFDLAVFLPAVSIGCFSAGVLNLNNLRDRENDAANGKRTLVVKKGLPWAKKYHVFLLVTGFVSAVIYGMLRFETPWQFLFILIIPLLLASAVRVLRNESPEELIPELKKLALTTFLFSIIFGIGNIL